MFVGGVLFLAILIADPNDFWPHFVVYKAQKSKSNIVNKDSKFPITFFGHFQGKICKMLHLKHNFRLIFSLTTLVSKSYLQL